MTLNTQTALIALSCYVVVREVFYNYQLNKLLNKAMSRSYYEYKTADSMRRETSGTQHKVDATENDYEALETLKGLMS